MNCTLRRRIGRIFGLPTVAAISMPSILISARRGWVDQPRDAARHRRLARAGFADDAERLAAADRSALTSFTAATTRPPWDWNQRALAIRLEQDSRCCSTRPGPCTGSPLRRRRWLGTERATASAYSPRVDWRSTSSAGALLDDRGRHLHHDDAVGDFGHDAEIMGDEQHAGAWCDSCISRTSLQNLRLRGDVERGGRLVCDQQRRIEYQRRGDHDTLALTAGELVRIGCRSSAPDRAG